MSPNYPRTPDGRYFVVRGRLWRLSNPQLAPDAVRRLTAELMQARRAVRLAKGDPSRLTAARAQVDSAKRALGERGPVWWSDGARDFNRCLVFNSPYADWYEHLAPPDSGVSPVEDADIERTVSLLLNSRSALASCCPSEVARALAPGDDAAWRALMPRVLRVLSGLVIQRRVRVTRGKRVLDVTEFGGGPIRIRRGDRFE